MGEEQVKRIFSKNSPLYIDNDLQCFMREQNIFQLTFESKEALRNYSFNENTNNTIKCVNITESHPTVYSILDYITISKALSPGPFPFCHQAAFRYSKKIGFVFLVEYLGSQETEFHKDIKFGEHEYKLYKNSCCLIKRTIKGDLAKNENCICQCNFFKASPNSVLEKPYSLFNNDHPLGEFWHKFS